MSAELIGILGVGSALAGLILTAALWIGGWLRDVDRGLARLEGLIKVAGRFRSREVPSQRETNYGESQASPLSPVMPRSFIRPANRTGRSSGSISVSM